MFFLYFFPNDLMVIFPKHISYFCWKTSEIHVAQGRKRRPPKIRTIQGDLFILSGPLQLTEWFVFFKASKEITQGSSTQREQAWNSLFHVPFAPLIILQAMEAERIQRPPSSEHKWWRKLCSSLRREIVQPNAVARGQKVLLSGAERRWDKIGQPPKK